MYKEKPNWYKTKRVLYIPVLLLIVLTSFTLVQQSTIPEEPQFNGLGDTHAMIKVRYIPSWQTLNAEYVGLLTFASQEGIYSEIMFYNEDAQLWIGIGYWPERTLMTITLVDEPPVSWVSPHIASVILDASMIEIDPDNEKPYFVFDISYNNI